ncbi:MAG: DUF4007 family protein [Actinobacteria bacterium]|uniref:Unannotated protein n=1 Tax=freshwater metagenome TaxID=449393 RepID=A0A6J7QWC9_9ZZZZ|nr:DUF4007 family protein [Actinomycetota bacterium]MSW79025.1 DUF4007 family protein [Actinomycetota bacterium]MSX55309.1 DUF4007 family protein [Actinomycetota bacterium]MSZ84716.1 DUF4007 family protein [Actinomycetota bacterium]MTB19393.1 DUF4007 family protein [Actinomycetota bacterium]
MERLSDAAVRAFARHETFHPRYGWFRKAVQAASHAAVGDDPFLADDATVELGVGKNMVRAIKFWGRAAKLIGEAPNSVRPRMPLPVPTPRGSALFDDKQGLDPFMELPGTQWLIHWWMLQPVTELPVWWLTFNRFTAVEFSEDELVNFVIDEIDRSGWDRPNESSLKKDVSCLLRMYCSSASDRSTIDDLLDCPMRELGLIEPAWGERHRYRFLLGGKPTLPDLVLLFTCLDWMSGQSATSKTVSLNRLATGIGSPGKSFRLTEADLAVSLGRCAGAVPGVQLSQAAGAPTLGCVGGLQQTAASALLEYYRVNGREPGSGISLSAATVSGVEPEVLEGARPAERARKADVLAELDDINESMKAKADAR